jgi:hypothetical protein
VDRAAAAHAAGIIAADELGLVRRARRLVDEVIRVDDFAPDLGWSEMHPATASMPRGTAHKPVPAHPAPEKKKVASESS